MHFSKILSGIALIITGLTGPVLAAHINPATVSDLYEKRGECQVKACSRDDQCSRHCTELCNNGHCSTSWVDAPCARGCKINKVGE